MIGPAPKYMFSEYWVNDKYGGHLAEGASDEDKMAFEKDSNGPGQLKDLKADHPNMKHPYLTWSGEIIDIG